MGDGFSIGLVYTKRNSLFLAYERDRLLYFKNSLFFKRRVRDPGKYFLIDQSLEFGVNELLAHWGAPVVEFDKVCAELFRHREVRDSRPAESRFDNRILRLVHSLSPSLIQKKSMELGEVLYFTGSARFDCPESFIGGAPGYMKAVTA